MEGNESDAQDFVYNPPEYDGPDEDLNIDATFQDSDNENGSLAEEDEQEEEDPQHPDTSLRDNFKAYCDGAKKNFLPFTKEQEHAVKLLDTLQRKKAPLDTFDEVMEWHLKSCGKLHEHEQLSDNPQYKSQKVLLKYLIKRYNMENMKSFQRKVTLPSSWARVSIVCHDVMANLQSLLMDPRVNLQDYLFFDGDPFAPPPENLDYIGDLNTGLAYTETWKHLITKPGRQVLLPIVLYIDGACTRQFNNLPITALKMALGIHTQKARDHDQAWRILGYVPSVVKEGSRGKKIFTDSGHLDSLAFLHSLEGNEGESGNDDTNSSCSSKVLEDDADPEVQAQDLHTILHVILKDFVEMQHDGFVWDLQIGDKLHKNVEFIPFVPFVKTDTDEADKLCGSYTNRNWNVAQLCRYCTCPTLESNLCLPTYPLKTEQKIQYLVEKGKEAKLKALSQQYINNAFYDLQMGMHNSQGIHGACPMELLHALLLGLFMYCRNCLFEQLGKESQLSDEINCLSQLIGALLTRQSDHSMPRTKFKRGIRKGKLMGKEYTGVLLIMAAIFCSTLGWELLHQKPRLFGKDETDAYLIWDWSLLVESFIQWEAWLKSDTYPRKLVMKAKTKHCVLMYLLKKVAKCSQGMQFKVMKFHGVIHMADNMLNFGNAEELNTNTNESGHKPTKQAAKLTQKNEETFIDQTDDQLFKFLVIDMAMAELRGRIMWEYYDKFVEVPQNPKKEAITTGGACIKVFYSDKLERNAFKFTKKIKSRQGATVEECALDFLVELQEKVADHTDDLEVRMEHWHNGAIFWAHPHYKGGPWRDWVMIDWGDWGILPGHIWFFVNLRCIPEGEDLSIFGGFL